MLTTDTDTDTDPRRAYVEASNAYAHEIYAAVQCGLMTRDEALTELANLYADLQRDLGELPS